MLERKARPLSIPNISKLTDDELRTQIKDRGGVVSDYKPATEKTTEAAKTGEVLPPRRFRDYDREDWSVSPNVVVNIPIPEMSVYADRNHHDFNWIDAVSQCKEAVLWMVTGAALLAIWLKLFGV